MGEAGERRMLRAPVWGGGVGRRKTQVRAGMMAAGLTYIPGVLVILFRVWEDSLSGNRRAVICQNLGRKELPPASGHFSRWGLCDLPGHTRT